MLRSRRRQREEQAMRAHVGYQGLDADWIRVSFVTPCPVCGGARECRTHVEEEFACCLREPSDWRLVNGGWLHRIGRARIEPPLGSVSAEPRPSGASSGVVS
jgi:hypothetical protein